MLQPSTQIELFGISSMYPRGERWRRHRNIDQRS